jgi:histone RNA hairpin-binding protein
MSVTKEVNPLVVLTDQQQRAISQRKKQIELGKSRIGYLNYIKWVPKNKRNYDLLRTIHPRTPKADNIQKYSKRAFAGVVRIWRRQLHYWDTVDAIGNPTAVRLDDVESILSRQEEEDLIKWIMQQKEEEEEKEDNELKERK